MSSRRYLNIIRHVLNGAADGYNPPARGGESLEDLSRPASL
ncbi:hypothetical protein [Neomoorella thermoacetica]|nr:hypothetical protein [Moorella thermoacetica]